jgi:transposase
VSIDLDALPDDNAALQQMLRDVVGTVAERDAQLNELTAENEKLQSLILRLMRHRFGRRSEQLTPDQLLLAVGDLEQEAAERAAEEAKAPEKTRERRSKPPQRNLGALPAHLPRHEVVLDIDSKVCPCCRGELHQIGETTTEMLDLVPTQLRVKVLRRPRYGCRKCEACVVQAPAPERPIDHRQSQMLARQGIRIDRSTLGAWVGRACWWLRPLYQLTVAQVMPAAVLFADDTTLPVLEPGRGKTRTGRLWCYAVDNRPWQGGGPVAAAYVYSEDRGGEHPAEHLATFRGKLQVDGYKGFSSLARQRDGEVELVFCWAHCRRRFYEFYTATQSRLAADALARIASLYAIEAEIRGHPAEHRRSVRQQRSRPIVEALHTWLQETLPRLSGSSDLAKAIRYMLHHWPGLILFLDDGRLSLDTNVVERGMRPVALARKNALFAGSAGAAEHWAIALTLIQTAKLNGLDPLAYLTDVLERVVSGRTKHHELEQLLAWNWKPTSPANLAAAA